MRALLPWLLGGALAASLCWNRTLIRSAACAPGTACGVGASACEPTVAGLEDDERARLFELCERACGAAQAEEQRAADLKRELLALLAAQSPDRAQAARLVERIGEHRRRALAACVEGVFEMHGVLSHEHVAALLADCR